MITIPVENLRIQWNDNVVELTEHRAKMVEDKPGIFFRWKTKYVNSESHMTITADGIHEHLITNADIKVFDQLGRENITPPLAI